MEIKRIWNSGPLRQWSEKRTSKGQIEYDKGGYVGMYVCDGLPDIPSHTSGHGVYKCLDGLWRCADCKVNYSKIKI
jgi:hypothetical protein